MSTLFGLRSEQKRARAVAKASKADVGHSKAVAVGQDSKHKSQQRQPSCSTQEVSQHQSRQT